MRGLLGLAVVFVCGARAEVCPTRLRGVFDVGSGATKLNLFEVEICAKEVRLKRIVDDQMGLPVALEAGKSKDDRIAPAALRELTQALLTLKGRAFETAAKLSPRPKEIEFSAVGTHAVRTARNRAAILEAAAKADVPLTALTQTQEAEAAYRGVQLKGKPTACGERRLLVWDIGGGSMQWVLEVPGDTPEINGLPLGAESFKQKLIEALSLNAPARCGGQKITPNPIGTAKIARAEQVATRLAGDVPEELLGLKNVCVVGLGGVHGRALDQAITKNYAAIAGCVCEAGQNCRKDVLTYRKREVDCLAARFSAKNDCDADIKGPYSTTNVSNLFLVSGFLRALHQTEVHVLNVNAGHGFALDRTQLKFALQVLPLQNEFPGGANGPGK